MIRPKHLWATAEAALALTLESLDKVDIDLIHRAATKALKYHEDPDMEITIGAVREIEEAIRLRLRYIAMTCIDQRNLEKWLDDPDSVV